jgi:pimeloyl-ACP methyl ester carboxylesterase
MECAVRTWGHSGLKPLIAWHGFARNSLDFNTLAESLCATYFVIAPDTPGRGLSAWLSPELYRFETYTDLAQLMIEHFAAPKPVDWIGTSMGGIIGMLVAEQRPELIRSLVLNDIGPEVPQSAIDRIASYTGILPIFPSLQEAEAHFRAVYVPFGTLTDNEWAQLTLSSVRRTADGLWTPHYDPNINKHFGVLPRDSALAWARFEAMSCPTLVIRGETSDLLTDAIAERMRLSRNNVQRVDFKNAGHAPYLNTTSQIRAIKQFLASD